jgi:hypothetical protein
LTVTTAVEAVAAGLARGGGNRRDTALHGEGRFAMQPVMVLACGDQELPGGVDAHAVGVCQAGVDLGHQRLQQLVEVGDLGGDLPVAAGQRAQRDLCGAGRASGSVALAAWMASIGSDLPWKRRVLRSGRSISITSMCSACGRRVSPAP